STPHFAGGGVNFDPNTGNLLLSGIGQVSRSANVRSDWNNYGPRIGFAYRALASTVVRGGFGRSYFSSNYGGGVFGTLCCPFPVPAAWTPGAPWTRWESTRASTCAATAPMPITTRCNGRWTSASARATSCTRLTRGRRL